MLLRGTMLLRLNQRKVHRSSESRYDVLQSHDIEGFGTIQKWSNAVDLRAEVPI